MPGSKALRVGYFGKETTPGTAVTPTWAWAGEAMGMPQDKTKIVKIATQEGIVGGVNRSAVAYIESAMELGETPFTFEQFPYLLAMCFGGPVVNAQKTYLTNIPTTTLPVAANCAYSIRAGDDFQKYLMTYALGNKLTISGKQKELVKMGLGIQAGNIIQATGSDPTITIPSLEFLPFGMTKTYVDVISGTYGTTQVPGMVLAFSIELTPHWEDKNTNDGQIYKSFSQFTGFEIKGKYR